MNEQELRGLVREAVERHLGRPEKAAEKPFQHLFRCDRIAVTRQRLGVGAA